MIFNYKTKDTRHNTIYGIIFFLFVFTLSVNLFADEYLWPTNASRAITSTFAEYRPGRFHAGIDIKTWGKTGYNIFAVRDGYISRIRVSPYGYGRALYLTLDTGETVVYAHLHSFNQEIEDYVWSEQEKRGKYGIQLFLNSEKFKYKQGDFLGKTGQTGVGYPHLHFEIRDPNGEPFNPFMKGYNVDDFLEPVITKVSFIPLNANSMVNGDWKPVVTGTINSRKGRFVLDKPVKVNGLVGFGISAYDVMDNIPNKFGTYKNRLYIDDKLVFSSIYKKFSYAENNLALLDREFRLNQTGFGNFYKLYIDDGNTLPFYLNNQYLHGAVYFYNGPAQNIQQSPGVTVINGASHNFRMVVQDYWENESEVAGQLIVESPEFIDMVSAVNPFNFPSFLNYTLISDSIFYQINSEFYDNYIRLEFEPLNNIQDGTFISYQFVNREIQPLPVFKKNNNLVGAVPLSPDMNGPLKIFVEKIIDGISIKQNELLEFEIIDKKRSQTVYSKDGLCRIEFSLNSLFKPVFVRMNANIPDSNSQYKFASKIYDVEPKDVAMNKGAIIKIKYNNKTLVEKTGIYYKSNNGKWVFFGNIHEEENRNIAGYVGTFGTHALIVDDEPPEILSLYPGNNSHLQTVVPLLTAVFKDTLSGLMGEDNMQLLLDGKKVIAEYDPERLSLSYKVRQPLVKGEHTLELFLKDRCGNIATQKHNFWID
ncbi:M23 family metallopeptidase [candidate division KSB1 bacterium]|nr:M23 family metallopeptidase [candidate division KSB1 bacterium]